MRQTLLADSEFSLPMPKLREDLKIILGSIPPHSEICFFDYPVYFNIGDLLILRATEKFFADHSIRVMHRSSCFDLQLDLDINAETILVFQGGGNFGDLYPHHQQTKEKVLARFPKNRAVVLPQTVFFSDADKFEETKIALNKHQELHIYVRDQKSADRLRDVRAKVILCPDMAHWLYPISPTRRIKAETLYLLREDGERNLGQRTMATNVDWAGLVPLSLRERVRSIQSFYRHPNCDEKYVDRYRTWIELVNELLNVAINRFSEFEVVVSSRLHGAILASLIDKNVRFIDNSYGKISSYHQSWSLEKPKQVSL